VVLTSRRESADDKVGSHFSFEENMKQENIMKLYNAYLSLHIRRQIQNRDVHCCGILADEFRNNFFKVMSDGSEATCSITPPIYRGMNNLRETIDNIL